METEKKGLDPADALAFVGAARSDLADRLVTPWWYHPTLGLSLGLLIASFGTRSGWLVLAAALLYGLSLVVLPRLYRRTTGVWVDGTTPPRARKWALWLGAASAACLLVSVSLSGDGPQRWGCLVVGVVAFVAVQVLGRRFDSTLREELRDHPEVAARVLEA